MSFSLFKGCFLFKIIVLNFNNSKNFEICQLLRESRRNLLILVKTHQLTAQPDQLMKRINITGKLLLWDQKTLHTQVEFTSWISISQQTILSNQQRSTSLLEFIIQILIPMDPSVLIFWRSNGPQHSPSQKCFCLSVHCWQTPTQMILWFQRLLTSTRRTRQNMRQLPESGLESTLCESRTGWSHIPKLGSFELINHCIHDL